MSTSEILRRVIRMICGQLILSLTQRRADERYHETSQAGAVESAGHDRSTHTGLGVQTNAHRPSQAFKQGEIDMHFIAIPSCVIMRHRVECSLP